MDLWLKKIVNYAIAKGDSMIELKMVVSDVPASVAETELRVRFERAIASATADNPGNLTVSLDFLQRVNQP